MTTNTAIDDPLTEFAEIPHDAQQELLKLYAACELMLPEERQACAATQAGVAETLEALGIFPLHHRVSLAVIRLLTTATLDELATDERNGL